MNLYMGRQVESLSGANKHLAQQLVADIDHRTYFLTKACHVLITAPDYPEQELADHMFDMLFDPESPYFKTMKMILTQVKGLDLREVAKIFIRTVQ